MNTLARDFKGVTFIVSHGLYQLQDITSNLTFTPLVEARRLTATTPNMTVIHAC